MLYISRNNVVTTDKDGNSREFKAGVRYTFDQIGEGVDLSNFEPMSEAEARALDSAKGPKKAPAAPSAPTGEASAPAGAEEVK